MTKLKDKLSTSVSEYLLMSYHQNYGTNLQKYFITSEQETSGVIITKEV